MWDALKNGNWDANRVIELFMAVGLVVTVIVAVVGYLWSLVRREEIRANLKRDMLDRGLSVEQIEQLVAAPSEKINEKALEGNLASVLVQNEIPAPVLERVVRIYQQTDPATKKAVYDALEELIGSSPSEEQLVAAVGALCPPRSNATPTAQLERVPASA
jgi:hypothetical protein